MKKTKAKATRLTSRKPPTKIKHPFAELDKDKSFVVAGIENYNRLKSLASYWTNTKYGGKRRFSVSIDRVKNEVWVTRVK